MKGFPYTMSAACYPFWLLQDHILEEWRDQGKHGGQFSLGHKEATALAERAIVYAITGDRRALAHSTWLPLPL